MTAEAQMDLIILYEDEIRAAARALFVALKAADDPERFQSLMSDAVNACCVALGGAQRDDVTLVLSSKTSLIRREKTLTQPMKESP